MGKLKKKLKKATKSTGKFLKKNSNKIIGGYAMVTGAVLTATGVGAGIGAPLMAAGAGAAFSKKKDAARNALAAGATAGIGSAVVNTAKSSGIGSSVIHEVTGDNKVNFGEVVDMISDSSIDAVKNIIKKTDTVVEETTKKLGAKVLRQRLNFAMNMTK